MSVVINTNVDSIKIGNNLNRATSAMSTSMQRMSTGMKINSAKDDAAGSVISARMNVQISGNKIAQQNVQNGNSLLTTAEGNLDVIQENLSRIRDLTLQAKNGTYSGDELKAMQDEVDERMAEIDRINTSAKFSEISLFNDASGIGTNGITFQVGANSDADNTITAKAGIFEAVNFSALTEVAKADFKLVEGTDGAYTRADDDEYVTLLEGVDSAIDNITARKSLIGSAQNRLDSALNTLTVQYENLSSAKSVITDSDIASESSAYTQKLILQQVSTALLAEANQAPSIALSLI
ncbi:MAG: hypothetical protein IJD57_02900 [Candidatus Gastranaerophilales bacterium]|nr:hypothetical protein [Candidatus Gastranaerophilales bacterium]